MNLGWRHQLDGGGGWCVDRNAEGSGRWSAHTYVIFKEEGGYGRQGHWDTGTLGALRGAEHAAKSLSGCHTVTGGGGVPPRTASGKGALCVGTALRPKGTRLSVPGR